MRRGALLATVGVLVALAAAGASIGIAASNTRSPAGQPMPAHHHHAGPVKALYDPSVASAVRLVHPPPTRYREPKALRSRNGVLRVRFAPHDGTALINGRRWGGTRTFTGTFPGPTLHVEPGDTIEMTFVNRLTQVTNLHFHGFRVSPAGLADNVLRTIAPAVTSKSVKPRRAARIVVHIPPEHEQGLYWYHPHLHGLVDAQVYPGLAGLIVVGDVLRPFPWLHGIKRRVMALQSPAFGANGRLINVNNVRKIGDKTTLVNGHVRPTLRIRPGELQLWQIGNISNDQWYKLSFGGRKLHVIGEDGNPVGRTWSSKRLLLPPGKRFDLLIRGPRRGTYAIKSLHFDQGFGKFGEYTVLKVVSGGKPVRPLPLPGVVSPDQHQLVRDIENDPVSRWRQLTFRIKPPFPNAFYINDKLYDPRRVDERVRLDQTEVWLLRNVSTEDHPFHIHTNDFVVEKINGRRVAINGFQDIVSIPHMRRGKPGTVQIRQRYRAFQGEAVFHCHILFHEDHSMMGNILFGPPGPNPSLGY